MESISFCHGEGTSIFIATTRGSIALIFIRVQERERERERERDASPCTWTKFLYSDKTNELHFNFYNTLPLIKMKERKRATCDTNGNRKLTRGQSLVFKRSEKYRKWSETWLEDVCGKECCMRCEKNRELRYTKGNKFQKRRQKRVE